MAEQNKSDKSTSMGREGRNQSGLRDYNVRKILSLIRKNGSLPKAKIAKSTGLSAQAVTVITNELLEDALITKMVAKKGKVGKPIEPLTINPDGAFSIGLKVDRRNFELTLIDFSGHVRASLSENCAYPTVAAMLSFVKRASSAITMSLSDELKSRVKGLGVATPYQIWHWAEEAGAPQSVMLEWQDFDFEKKLTEQLNLPVYLSNDDSAACSAELCFGDAQQYRHFLYMHIGPFIGGGVVLDGRLFGGKSGNAGAIGSLPLGLKRTNGGQLITQASLYLLENKLKQAGISTERLYYANASWQGFDDILSDWIAQVSEALAYAALNATAILDLQAIIIDGQLPQPVKQTLVEQTQQIYQQADTRGLTGIEFCAGTLGYQAQTIGSANLPLLARYYD